MISDSVLLGMSVTNHVSAHCNILIVSAMSCSAEETGSSTMIKRLQSTANKRMQEQIFYENQKKAMFQVQNPVEC